MRKFSRSYYLGSYKIIRDLVHGYVNLSKYEMMLIDTPSFQRLKDIRQLSAQEVYPAARHTRFEHSLGMLELTKQALKHLKNNGVIDHGSEKYPVIDDNLMFNARLAALLHDVGHCPFSHLGEIEFDINEVREELYTLLDNEKNNLMLSSSFINAVAPNSKEARRMLGRYMSKFRV